MNLAGPPASTKRVEQDGSALTPNLAGSSASTKSVEQDGSILTPKLQEFYDFYYVDDRYADYISDPYDDDDDVGCPCSIMYM